MRDRRSYLTLTLTLAAVALLVWCCAAVVGAECPSSTSVYLEDLANCRNSVPEALRAYHSRVISGYLLTDDGNELRSYALTDPARPVLKSKTNYRVPPLGDIDWMLVHTATNPDSPYGVATYRTRTGLWRWNDGRFASTALVSERGMHPGVVYVAGGSSYVLSSDIHTESGAWVLRIDSTTELVPIQRVTGAIVSGGLQIGGTVYVVETSGTTTTLRVYSVGAGGGLSPVATAGTAAGGWTLGIAASEGRLLAASGSALRLWDVSAPATPVLLDTVSVSANAVALDGTLGMSARAGSRGSERVWSIVGDELTDITPGWFAGRWAGNAECVAPRGVALQGGRLYYSEWAVAEAIDASCLVPSAALIFGDGFESGNTAAWD